MAKIYTKTGDKGSSSLVGGTRVSKNDPRLNSYGEVDELNSSLGVLKSFSLNVMDLKDLELINKVQNNLFIVGSYLACESEKTEQFQLPKFDNAIISDLEVRIDELQQQLPTLKNFILPAGGQPASLAHMSRTICRRTERSLVAVQSQFEVNESFLVFINRLSDYLFVLARKFNHAQGIAEELWKTK